MTENTNPVIQEMLAELCDERPDIWPLVQQWLAHPLLPARDPFPGFAACSGRHALRSDGPTRV